MTRAASARQVGSEFDDFLFTSIGEDGNGMPLSVLSALARVGVDPWQEAAKLAALPVETATERLTALIATLPDAASAHRDSGTIAARLIALFPLGASSQIPWHKALLGAGAATKSWAVVYVIFMAFALSAQWIATRGQTQPPAQVNNAHPPVSSTGSPQIRPPNSD